MKFFVIILMLNVHVRAGSIFGEFRDAMSSLENSFQKMITDVVTDVRDTIDCTVVAVESALSLRSTISNPKCRGVVKDKNGNKNDMSLNILTDTSFRGLHKNSDYKIDISKPIKYGNQQHLQYKFTNDDDRFANIKNFLKNEFEKMSANMRIQFNEIESEEKSASDFIAKYINILHNMKHNSKNDSEVNEAKRILDGASKILDVDVKNYDDAKVNKLLTSLHGSNQDKINMQNTLSKIAENKLSRHNGTDLSPRTFKDIFNKALSTTQVKDNKKQINQKIEPLKSFPLNGVDLSHRSLENNVEPMDYDSLFGGGNGDSNKDAVDGAMKIFENSKKTNSILNNFFAQASQVGSSIFDNP